MRFLRHKNGGGKIDETSEACSLSLLDKRSILFDKSSVWSSALVNASIHRSTIAGAVVENSAIVRSIVTGGHIRNSRVHAELVADYAVVKNSLIAGGKCRIAHTAYLENVGVENLTVTGDARLLDWDGVFDGRGGYISRGTWRRPPKILYLESDLTVTESVAGFAFCGCREFAISHWLRVGTRYGAKLGLSESEVAEIRKFLHSLG